MDRKMTLKLSDVRTVGEIVYTKLRSAIVSGYFHPGSRLFEQELAREMGVSRTPVREALKRLELERLVTTHPHKGTVVTEFSLEEILEFYKVRACLEGLAAKLVAEKGVDTQSLEAYLREAREKARAEDIEGIAEMNNRFHMLLYEMSGNRFLRQMLEDLSNYVTLARISAWSVPGRSAETLEEHEAIIRAIKERRAEDAQNLAVKHVERAKEAARIVLTKKEPSGEEL